LCPDAPNPFLSLIIPAHNEEHRLPRTLEQVFAFLDRQSYTYEVLIVENGSADNTLEIARQHATHHPHLHAIHLDAPGKGRAVRHGMLAARGDYRFMSDVDLSMPIPEINRFLPPMLSDFDIAIGSREAPGATRYNEPYYRHLTGRVYNTLIRLLALPGLHDTQCGFKCFRGPVAESIFPLQTLTGWSFDVEILFIARKMGYRIVEIPIPWYYNADTRVQVLSDSVQMGLDLLKIRRNALNGKYEENKI
jgi:glycosyltransferase involved in cell wall biosynthesis